MNDDKILAGAYQRGTRPRSRQDCPSSAKLVESAAMGGADAELADHLADCSACSQEYLALRSVAPVPRDAGRPAAPRAWILAVAALLVIGVALGAFALALLQRSRALAVSLERAQAVPRASVRPAEPAPIDERKAFEPRPNVTIIDLLPAGAMVRGELAPGAAVPATASEITLILNVEDQRKFSDYSLEVVGSKGDIIWSGDGLQRSANDTFTLHVARRYFKDDLYQVRLYGVRETARTLIAQYQLDLRSR